LFLDPVSNQVIDYVGGQADLQARVLRAIGDASERFAEDYLRMLRAVRFAARFNLTIDPATVHAIVSHRTRLKQISPERIAEELRLMLTPGTRVLAWRLLKTLDLLAEIFRHVPLPQKRPGNRPVAILETLAPDAPIAFGTALATATIALWLEADPSEGALRNLFEKSQIGACVSAMRKTLRISNDEADLMADILSGLGVLLAGDLPSLAAKKRFLARPDARETGHVLDALAAGGHFQHRISTLKPELETLAQTEFAPPPLITGDDLTAAGHAPGPAFKMALDAAYDAQLEGRAASRETAMEIAGAFFK
jgi:poly(A) polymerase